MVFLELAAVHHVSIMLLIRTDLVLLRLLRQGINSTVKAAIITRRVTIDLSLYKALIAATGGNEEKDIVTRVVTRNSAQHVLASVHPW